MSWNSAVAWDLRRGIFRKIYLFPMFQFIFLSFFFWLNTQGRSEKALLGDYLFSFFCGISPVQVLQNDSFSLPTTWLQIMACSMYINLSYPLCDLTKEGEQNLIRCGSRRIWYLSKCLWNISASIAYFLSAVVAAIIVTFLTGGKISLDFHPIFFEHLTNTSMNSAITAFEKVLVLALIPLTAIAAINMLQMTLSFLIRPVYGFLVCLSILVTEIFFPAAFLPGNGAMVLRSSILFPDGRQASAIPSAIINLLLIALCIPIGMKRFQNYDILPAAGKE